MSFCCRKSQNLIFFELLTICKNTILLQRPDIFVIIKAFVFFYYDKTDDSGSSGHFEKTAAAKTVELAAAASPEDLIDIAGSTTQMMAAFLIIKIVSWQRSLSNRLCSC